VNLTVKRYRVTMQHDHGMVRVETAATSMKSAVKMVCAAEGAPRGAVIRAAKKIRKRARAS
jgi:hypothetical protein